MLESVNLKKIMAKASFYDKIAITQKEFLFSRIAIEFFLFKNSALKDIIIYACCGRLLASKSMDNVNFCSEIAVYFFKIKSQRSLKLISENIIA